MAPHVIFSHARQAGYSEPSARRFAQTFSEQPLPVLVLVRRAMYCIAVTGTIAAGIVQLATVL